LERESSDDAGDVEMMTEVGEIWSGNLQTGEVGEKTEVGGIWSGNLQTTQVMLK
jgi:hypothetical protein